MGSLGWSAPARDNHFWQIRGYFAHNKFNNNYEIYRIFPNTARITVDHRDYDHVVFVVVVFGQRGGTVGAFYGNSRVDPMEVRDLDRNHDRIVDGYLILYRVNTSVSGNFIVKDYSPVNNYTNSWQNRDWLFMWTK